MERLSSTATGSPGTEDPHRHRNPEPADGTNTVKLKLSSLLLILLDFEVGILLVFSPWSVFWERNGLLAHYPALEGLVLHSCFRGAVTGLGLVLIVFGCIEVFQLSTAGRRGRKD